MGVMTAFAIGLGMAALKGKALRKVMDEFRQIIKMIIEKIIIPLLPIHIFASMTQGEQASAIM